MYTSSSAHFAGKYNGLSLKVYVCITFFLEFIVAGVINRSIDRPSKAKACVCIFAFVILAIGIIWCMCVWDRLGDGSVDSAVICGQHEVFFFKRLIIERGSE